MTKNSKCERKLELFPKTFDLMFSIILMEIVNKNIKLI
jgi:hypothetical protein